MQFSCPKRILSFAACLPDNSIKASFVSIHFAARCCLSFSCPESDCWRWLAVAMAVSDRKTHTPAATLTIVDGGSKKTRAIFNFPNINMSIKISNIGVENPLDNVLKWRITELFSCSWNIHLWIGWLPLFSAPLFGFRVLLFCFLDSCCVSLLEANMCGLLGNYDGIADMWCGPVSCSSAIEMQCCVCAVQIE